MSKLGGRGGKCIRLYLKTGTGEMIITLFLSSLIRKTLTDGKKSLHGDGEHLCKTHSHENINQCLQCRNKKVKVFDKLS